MVYRGRTYRNWRSRGWKNSSPSKYLILSRLFGGAVGEIKKFFLDLDEEALNELLLDYGEIHSSSAATYARETFAKWKSGEIKLSGQTMERLIELVPPYLSASQRYSILKIVLEKHSKNNVYKNIKINTKEPAVGFLELDEALNSIVHKDLLEYLPESVMQAATWLYDDDITSARAMLSEARRAETEVIKSNARREIELLKKTVFSGQVKSAAYSVEMPAGKVNVVVYSPSYCYVATACFGSSAPETQFLRSWRDFYLLEKAWGRKFVVWYYNHSEKIVVFTNKSWLFKKLLKLLLKLFILIISKNKV